MYEREDKSSELLQLHKERIDLSKDSKYLTPVKKDSASQANQVIALSKNSEDLSPLQMGFAADKMKGSGAIKVSVDEEDSSPPKRVCAEGGNNLDIDVPVLKMFNKKIKVEKAVAFCWWF